MSSFGWTYLSRDALRRAQNQLSGAGEGVRDEIGFLIIHQRYADHFFPGTSVLHTRLRYSLFVPWIYQTLYEDGSSGRVQESLQKAEIRLAGRLKHLRGAIGGANFPDPTSQPASLSYWAALGAWRILRETDGRLPTRAQIHALLQSKHRKAKDDDGVALSRAELPFTAMPPRPDNWSSAGPLEFALLPREADFLRRQFADLRPRDAPGQKSLLAKLSAGPRIQANACWSPSIAEIATDDSARLRRAQHAASLAAVGRAVYAALVETLKEEMDHQIVSRKHRNNLPVVLEHHASLAARLDLGKLIEDTRTITGTLPPVLHTVLEATLAWISDGAKDPMILRDTYELARSATVSSTARACLGCLARADAWNGTTINTPRRSRCTIAGVRCQGCSTTCGTPHEQAVHMAEPSILRLASPRPRLRSARRDFDQLLRRHRLDRCRTPGSGGARR